MTRIELRPPLPARASRESPSPPKGGEGKVYAVKECFLTLQGEGVQSGSRAVFLRFAGCNLWSGREQDRASANAASATPISSARTERAAGSSVSADALADHVAALWGSGTEARLVVITGGEPMLQLDEPLVDSTAGARLSRRGGDAMGPCPPSAASTGSASAPRRARRWCSARATSSSWCGRRRGSIRPSSRIGSSTISSCSRWTVQAGDDALQAAISLAMERPRWRLSLQAHKVVGLP